MSDSDCNAPGFPVLHHFPEPCSNSWPSRWWCHPTILSSAIPFSSCLQPFSASGSFLMSQLFTSGGQSSGPSASVLPMNIQAWFSLGLTGWISLQSKGLSRVFSNTTVQKHWHVNPWLIHVNVWQKPLQYCKVISLQLIKINEGKKKSIDYSVLTFLYSSTLTSIHAHWKNHSLD